MATALTGSVDELMECYNLTEEDCNQEITDIHLQDIPLDFVENWRLLNSHVGMPRIVVKDIQRTYDNEKEKRCAFFYEWKERKGSEVRYKKLISALLAIGSRADAEEVCKLLRKSLKPQQEKLKEQKSSEPVQKKSFPQNLLEPQQAKPVEPSAQPLQVKLKKPSHKLLEPHLVRPEELSQQKVLKSCQVKPKKPSPQKLLEPQQKSHEPFPQKLLEPHQAKPKEPSAGADFSIISKTVIKHQNASEKKIKQPNTLCVMACGLTGVGKSTLLNILCGIEAFPVGHSVIPTTYKVDTFTFKQGDYRLILCDSPGFKDESGKDDEYLEMIRRKCADVDTLMYCIKVNENRIKMKYDLATLQKLREALDESIWNSCVIVFTFANALIAMLKYENATPMKIKSEACSTSTIKEQQEYNARIELWKGEVVDTFRRAGIVPDNMPIVEAGCASMPLLFPNDKKPWLTTFWETVRNKSPPDGQEVLSHISINCIPSSFSPHKCEDSPLHNQSEPTLLERVNRVSFQQKSLDPWQRKPKELPPPRFPQPSHKKFSYLEEDMESVNPTKLSQPKTLCVMACGLTGSGKRTLLNGLCGREEFIVGHCLSIYVEVNTSIIEHDDYRLILCHTPGFEDETGTEDEYLEIIKKECADVDTLFYCISVNATRIKMKDDLATLKKLHAALDERVWNHCVIVLTFANALIEKSVRNLKTNAGSSEKFKKCAEELIHQEYSERIDQWKAKILETFRRAGINPDNIPIVVTGSDENPLLFPTDKKPWLTTFWETVREKSPPDGKDVLFQVNIKRISSSFRTHRRNDLPLHKQQLLVVQHTFWERFRSWF